MNNLSIKPLRKPPVLEKYCFLSAEAQKTLAIIEAKYSVLIKQKNKRKDASEYYQSIYNSNFKKNTSPSGYNDIRFKTGCENKLKKLIARSDRTSSQNSSYNVIDKTVVDQSTSHWCQSKTFDETDSLPWNKTNSLYWFDKTEIRSANFSATKMSGNEEVEKNVSHLSLKSLPIEHEDSNVQEITTVSSNALWNISDSRPINQCVSSNRVPHPDVVIHDDTTTYFKDWKHYLKLEDSPLLFASLGEESEDILEDLPDNICPRESEESPLGSVKCMNDDLNQQTLDQVDFDLHMSDFDLSQTSVNASVSPNKIKIIIDTDEDPLVTSLDILSHSKDYPIGLDNESPSNNEVSRKKSKINTQANSIPIENLNQKGSGTSNAPVKLFDQECSHAVNETEIKMNESFSDAKKFKMELTYKGKASSELSEKDSRNAKGPLKEKNSYKATDAVKRRKKEFKPPVKITKKEPATEATVSLPELIKFSTLHYHDQEELLSKFEAFSTVSLTYIYRNKQASISSFFPLDFSQCLLSQDAVECLVIFPCHQTISQCYVIELQDTNKDKIRKMLSEVLASRNTLKIICNFKQFLIANQKYFEMDLHQGFICNNCEDPVIAAWMINPENQPSNFTQICQTAGINFKCDDQDWLQCLQKSFSLMENLKEKLASQKLWSVFASIEMNLTPLLAKMEMYSIQLDMDRFTEYSNILKCKLKKLEDSIYSEAGHKFCLNSHIQLRQVLFEELKLDLNLPPKTKLGVTNAFHLKSTSESSLNILSEFHPLPSKILEYRQLKKLKSTYIDGIMSCAVDGRLTSHWSQTAAATGRITSSQPNIQAVPKVAICVTDYVTNYIIGSNMESRAEILAREPYVSNPGHVLLAADFQQIELRVLAHLSEDSGLLSTFWQQKSQDIFISLASQWCNKSIEEVTPAERERTKRVVYSIIYGVGKERLSEYLKVHADIAKEIMNNFLAKFPAIEAFIKTCWHYAREHGYTETISGRKRYFPHINSSSQNLRSQAQRQAVNFCVQGSAADICKLAMICVDEKLKQQKHLTCKLLIQIHDELVWEVPEGQLKEVKELIQQVMEDSKTVCGRAFFINKERKKKCFALATSLFCKSEIPGLYNVWHKST
ncbi:hypothetical protein Btru_028298 [Bulinus truncatus]|nr:hypothetical protein Btru_028298 [Bulinus truncatus]